MNATNWTPGSLLQLSGSYWQAFTLHAGVKLELTQDKNSISPPQYLPICFEKISPPYVAGQFEWRGLLPGTG